MINFWIVAALLLAAGLGFLLPPLLRRRTGARGIDRDAMVARVYRDELAELKRDLTEGRIDDAGYQAAIREIERRLLEDTPHASERRGIASERTPAPRAALGLALAVPVAGVLMYLVLGTPDAIDPSSRFGSAQDSQHITRDQIEVLVAKLAERLKRTPEDAEGWVMLARTYTVLERFEDAARAYASAVNLVRNDAGLLADYADALAVTRGRKLAGEPYDIVKRALKIDPRHVKSLALAGSAEFERGNYAAAVDFWQRGLAPLPKESQFAQSLRASMEEARSRLRPDVGGRPGADAGKPKRKAASAAGLDAVSGTVRIAPALASRVAPGDTLYIFARPEGSRMPIAIVKVKASDLPYRFRLDDELAMTPDSKLSQQTRIQVGARVSKTGNAVPQSGDLQGASASVAPGASGVVVTIDEVVP